MIKFLKQALLSLSPQEWASIMMWMQRRTEKNEEERNFMMLVNQVNRAMENVLGTPLLYGSRIRMMVDAKDAITLYLRNIGMSYRKIGIVINKDHSTACLNCQRAADKLRLAKMYPEFNEMYNKFKKEMERYDCED